MRKTAILVLIFCAILYEGKAQVSVSLNTGLVFSKGIGGSSKEPDWGRGGGKQYQLLSSTFKPGALIGVDFRSSKNSKVYPSFSINFLWLQNQYNYSGVITNPYTTWNLDVDVVSKSIYISTHLSLNVRLTNLNKAKIYFILGLAPSIQLSTKVQGSVIENKYAYPGVTTIDTLGSEAIYWTTKAVFLSGIFGVGIDLELLKIPMDIQLSCFPSFTDLYSLPNLQTAGIYIMVHFQLYSKRKKEQDLSP